MEEAFLKSALPAPGRSLLDDSTLALPAEPTPGSPTKPGSGARSLRVYKQVQLTLARNARKTVSNGGVCLDKIKAKSFDATDGSSPHTKVNGLGFSNSSLLNSHVRRPSRRVEVSPTQTLELPRFNYTTPCYGSYEAYAFPEPSHFHMVDHTLGSDSFWRYAFSEVPRGTQLHTSPSTHRNVRRRTLRQTAGPQTALVNSAFERNGEYGSHWSQNQTALKQETHTVQRQHDMVLGAFQPDDELSFLHRLRRNGQVLHRMNSYPASVASMEVDRGRQGEVALPNEWIQTQNVMTLKSENEPPEMTIEKAVNLLTKGDEETLICAASHIKKQCFKSEDAKQMVRELSGIGKLLQLFDNESDEVQLVVAGALRNLVFQNRENTMEVMKNNGLLIILAALKRSRDVEMRRQLTGLLWNLSSHDHLKDSISRITLSVLTKSVLVPSSGISEGENPKDELLADAEVFYNTTSCLRNLSSAGPHGRKKMRDCKNLIDSLVFYIRGTLADHKSDDESTENCTGILQNLSYQIDAEFPKKHNNDLGEYQQNLARKPKSVGCFAYRSTKITEHLERQSPLLEEKANPCGIEWLWSPITIRMYVSLIACSVRHNTKKAAIGALQNITAGNGAASAAIAFTIVKRENNLLLIQKILKEGETEVKWRATYLIRNLSRYPELQPNIVKQVLPELVGMLPNVEDTDLPTDVTASLCHILNNLIQNDAQHVGTIFNQGALQRIISISCQENGAGQAACMLLQSMWKHSELHKSYKEIGYRKSDFINARTKAMNIGQN